MSGLGAGRRDWVWAFGRGGVGNGGWRKQQEPDTASQRLLLEGAHTWRDGMACRAFPTPNAHCPVRIRLSSSSRTASPRCHAREPRRTRRRPRRMRVRSRSSPKRATEDDPAAQSATTSTRRWTASARSCPPELRTWKSRSTSASTGWSSRSMSASVPSRIGFRPSVTGSTPWTRRCLRQFVWLVGIQVTVPVAVVGALLTALLRQRQARGGSVNAGAQYRTLWKYSFFSPVGSRLVD